jgi:ribonuclease-3
LPIPEYEVVECEGPSHSPYFKIQVHVEGVPPEQGEGESKKKAEKDAATKLLQSLNLI